MRRLLELGAMGVVVALGLEGGGAGFEAGGVGEDVVAGCDAVEGDLLRAGGGGGNRGDGNVPAEKVIESGEHHGGAALLALTAVASDMGCGDNGFFKQFSRDVRLVFPAVKGDIAVPLQECSIVGDGTTGGIENQAATVQTVEECLVAQVPCGPLSVAGDGRVKGDDVTAALQLVKRTEYVIKRTVPIFPRGVVEQDVEAELSGPAGDDGADVAHADDAQGEAVGGSDAMDLHPSMDGTENPLGDSRSVTTRSVANSYAMTGAVVEVDMVSADGRRADETHTAAIE